MEQPLHLLDGFLTFWDVSCALVMFAVLFSGSVSRFPLVVRVGYAMCAVSLLFQASVSMNGLPIEHSFVWVMKDIGLGILILFAGFKIWTRKTLKLASV